MAGAAAGDNLVEQLGREAGVCACGAWIGAHRAARRRDARVANRRKPWTRERRGFSP